MIEEEFVKYYKVFKFTESIDYDLKSIRKINNLISKWKKTGKALYKNEALNILRSCNNIFKVDSNFFELISKNFIEDKNRSIFKQLYIDL